MILIALNENDRTSWYDRHVESQLCDTRVEKFRKLLAIRKKKKRLPETNFLLIALHMMQLGKFLFVRDSINALSDLEF